MIILPSSKSSDPLINFLITDYPIWTYELEFPCSTAFIYPLISFTFVVSIKALSRFSSLFGSLFIGWFSCRSDFFFRLIFFLFLSFLWRLFLFFPPHYIHDHLQKLAPRKKDVWPNMHFLNLFLPIFFLIFPLLSPTHFFLHFSFNIFSLFYF